MEPKNGAAERPQRSPCGRLLLVDPHRLVRECLAIALRQHGYTVVAEASDGQEALARLQETLPDAVVLEIDLSTESGLALCRVIGRRFPALPVVVLTGNPSPQIVFQAVLAGVAGFVLKTRPLDVLLANLDAVMQGTSLIDRMAQQVAHQWLRSTEARIDRDPMALLSQREREVAVLVAEGKTNREIGEILFISPRTARNHVINILNKLGVGSRAEIAALLARHSPQ